jgi:zinc protease
MRVFLLLLVAGAAAAQSNDTPPPVAAPRPIVIEAPEITTLDNGLRVIVARRGALPLVTADLVIRSGTETDPRALSGLADMTATLLTKGTAKRTAPQIATAAEALGGSLDSGAAWYRSSVSMTVTKPKVREALALIAEVTLTPRFAEPELERARKLALDGLSVALRDPGALAGMAVDRAAFGTGTFGHPAHGTPASLAKIRRADVVAQHARYYRPDNASLVFVGDIEMQAARELAQSVFGRWKRPSAALPASALDNGERFASPPIVIAMDGAGQAGVAMAAKSIARSAPDYYAGVIANTLLGGGYSSRLNLEIRVKRGLSYGIDSRLEARRTGGVWSIGAQTKSESAPELVEVTLGEVRRVSDAPPSAEELEARKLAVIGGTSRTFETTETLASLIAAYEANSVPLTNIPKIIDALNAVTAAQVQDFAKAHFTADSLSIVIAGDAAKFLDALRKAYPEVRVIAQGDVDLERPSLTKQR